MSILAGFLAGMVADPLEETHWLVLADWLEEFDDPRRAELLRLHRKMLATCCEPDRHPDRAEWQARMVALLVGGVRPCVPRETLLLPGGVEMTFSFIPPGRFLMGSDHPEADDAEKPVHEVTLTRGFYLGTTPVTQAQWNAVMGTNTSYFQSPTHPVVQLSWEDCQQYCGKLKAHLGGRVRVRLPTEAEWEYACRAGTNTEYHFGDQINTELANYDGKETWNGSPVGKFRALTTDVGTFPANAWGLFDVHGNIWEYCEDAWNETFYAQAPAENPLYDNYINTYLSRGGSYVYNSYHCRAANRFWHFRGCGYCDTGLRLAFCLD
jgi:uncharacterized protein (TIGR02996 family)